MSMWLVAQALTDAQGRARLPVPPDDTISDVYAYKAGAGFDYRSFDKSRYNTDTKVKAPAVPTTAIPLRLEGARTVQVTILDGDRKPIAGLPLYPWTLQKPGEVNDINISGAAEEFTSTTDEAGVAVWDWFPQWQKGGTTFWPKTKEYENRQLHLKPETGDAAQFLLFRLEWLRGKVTLPDGNPAPGITIRATGQGYSWSGFHGVTKTGTDGKYELRVPPNHVYLVVVEDENMGSGTADRFRGPGENPDARQEFRSSSRHGHHRPAYLGQSTNSHTQSKLHDPATTRRGLFFPLRALKLPNPENSQNHIRPLSLSYHATTDQAGHFEFHAGPGEYYLMGPSQIKQVKITVTDQAKLEYNFNAPRVEKGFLKGTVVTGTPPTPVAEATVNGIYRANVGVSDLSAKTDAKGIFESERQQHRTVLHAHSADGKLAGVLEIGPDDATVTLALTKVATARGRLLDGETSAPMPNREIVYGSARARRGMTMPRSARRLATTCKPMPRENSS